MDKAGRQYVAKFTANLAFHLVSLAAIVGRNHDVQQVVSSVGNSLSNHLKYFGVKYHCATPLLLKTDGSTTRARLMQ